MIDLNHSRKLAACRRAGCFRVPFLLSALVAAVERQSLLLLGWLLLATPVAVQAQFNYTVTNGTVTITGYTGTNSVVVIPDTITGLPVTAIEFFCLDDLTWNLSLTSVTIPNSVTSIGDSAFGFCASLTNVTIGNGVTSIGDFAFSGLGDDGKLYGCPLMNITIPNSVTNIGADAFASCTKLSNVNLGNGVTSVGRGTFSDCINLTSIMIPNSVTSIGDYAFYECYSLTTVTIPNSVTNLGAGAFAYCIDLTSITIPTSVTSIGGSAFEGCGRLTNVTIPNSVTNIGADAFASCTNLTATNVETNNPVYSSLGGVLFNQSQTTLIRYPSGKVGFYSIPNSVISIAASAFNYCGKLTGVTIGPSVTSIGAEAFDQCTSLTSVTIPDRVTNIKDGYVHYDFQGYYSQGYPYFHGTFSYCTSLTKVTIGNNVTNIGDYAFLGCTSLASVTIGNGVASIGSLAFAGCGLTSVAIPDSVTNIKDGGATYYASYVPEGTFSYCTSLTNVTIGNNVTNIGDYAFFGCTSLSSLTIGPSVSRIGAAAFDQCISLTSVTIGPSVTSIGASAFVGTSLSSVTIPNSVTNIGANALASTRLTAINVETNNPVYSSRDGVLFNQSQTTLIRYPWGRVGSYSIPNSVKYIGSGAFDSCSGLTSVTIPDSVTSIEDEAFDFCGRLTNVTIANGVTSVGYRAFSDCINLTSIMIPNSVTSIENAAFSECDNLVSVYFQGNAPIGNQFVFLYDNKATAYYLPGTTGWSTNYENVPTALWTLPYPLILNNTPGFGVQSNQFGFTVSWATNASVVVEASTDLNNPKWSPVITNSLSGGTFYFSDPQWTNYSSRFYRVRSQ